jgi:hypothetical protein
MYDVDTYDHVTCMYVFPTPIRYDICTLLCHYVVTIEILIFHYFGMCLKKFNFKDKT